MTSLPNGYGEILRGNHGIGRPQERHIDTGRHFLRLTLKPAKKHARKLNL